MDHLETLLKSNNSYYKIIAVESLYSMDGSISKLEDLNYLKENARM